MGFIKWLGKVGATGGIARSQYYKFKRTRDQYPEEKEADLAPTLFYERFSRIRQTKKESLRINAYLETHDSPSSLREVCYAIAEIELNVTPIVPDKFLLVREIIDEELARLGYQEESE